MDEPWNLTANLALLLAAVAINRMSTGFGWLRILGYLAFVVFLGSVSLHLYPTYLTVGVTLSGILAFVLASFYGLNRDLLGLSKPIAFVCTALILPFGAASLSLIALLPGASSSAAYGAFLVLIWGYGVVLRPNAREAARGMFLAGLMLLFSLIFRTLDRPLCATLPSGTHFIWIIGSAVVLWLLARVYHRHMLAAGAGGR